MASTALSAQGTIVQIATGSGGVPLLDEAAWRDSPTLELISDANATPPLGVEGIDMMDKGAQKHGKTVFGAIGFGAHPFGPLARGCVHDHPAAGPQRLPQQQPHLCAQTARGGAGECGGFCERRDVEQAWMVLW